jgi:hypothetical protein
VKKKNSEESSTQWTTGIAEVQLPIECVLQSLYAFFRIMLAMTELNAILEFSWIGIVSEK